MKKWTNLLALALLLFCFSCNEMDKYYDNERHSTSVSVGNAWDYLSSRGNFTCFLTGVEKSGFKSLVSGTGLATIFAPTDDAFRKYFMRHGREDADQMTSEQLRKCVEDMTTPEELEELKNMITYHLLYYAFTPDQFMSYNPDGAGTEIDSDKLGQYYKFRTKSRDAIEDVTDPISGENVKLFHFEKYIPVFSENLFHTYSPNGAAQTDYESFFKKDTGGVMWKPEDGDDKGHYFRIANAGVREYGIITDNGYLYILDDVVEPLKTIHQTLEAEGYSSFLKAYDRFSDLQYNEGYSLEYGGGQKLYVYSHIDLPSIANEWYSEGRQGGEQLNMRAGGVVFAPSDVALNDFYGKYWSYGYGDDPKGLDSVKFLPLYSLIGDQIAAGVDPVFPSNLGSSDDGSPLYDDNSPFAVKTALSRTPVHLDMKNPMNRCIYCSNGIVYGVDKLVAEPPYFQYITAPAFIYPYYYMFLLLMDKASLTNTYLTSNRTFYAFYPSDEIIQNTMSPEDTPLFLNKSSEKYGGEDIAYRGEDQMIFSLNGSYSSRIVQSHICDECFHVGGDEIIYKTSYQTFNYLYRKGDSIFSAALYNQHHGKIDMFSDEMPKNLVTVAPVDVPVEIQNGEVYKLSGEANAGALLPEVIRFQDYDNLEVDMPVEIKEGGQDSFFECMKVSQSDSTHHLEVFDIMRQESRGGNLPRFIFFALSSEAVTKGYDSGVIVDPNGLWGGFDKNYMPNLFVSVSRSNLMGYPFPSRSKEDGKEEKGIPLSGGAKVESCYLSTYKKKPDGTYTTILLKDVKENGVHHLEVAGEGDVANNHTVRIKNTFPYIYADCAVYILEEPLDFGEYNHSK